MKHLASILFLAASASAQLISGSHRAITTFGTGVCGGASAYSHTDTITLSAEGTLSADLPNNWPTLFTGDALLKSTANGGQVQSSGTDVVFCTANDGTGTVIPYYFVSATYDPTTGAGQWYFSAPCIKKLTSCLAYVYTGKASATDFSCVTGSTGSGANNCKTTLWTNYLRVYDYGVHPAINASEVDESNNAPSPTDHGVASNVGEVFGDAGFNSGASNYFDSGATLPALTNFTIETWFNTGSQGTYFPLANLDASANNGIFMIEIGDGGGACPSGIFGQACMGFGYHNGSPYYYKVSTALIKDSTWHHAVGVHTTGSTNLTLYIDGVVDSTAGISSSGSPGDPGTSTSTLQVGREGDWTGGPFYYTGDLDETRILSVVMTADEVKFDYLNQSNPTGTYTVSTP